MVKRIISFFGRDIESIHQAAYILAGATFLGQVLGLFRDRLLASTFGAGSLLDVYYAAFRLQDIIFVTIGSLLSAIILIPLFSEVEEKEGVEQLKKVINSVYTVGLSILLLVSLVGLIFAPIIAPIFFPGIPKEYHETLVTLMRLLLLSPFFFTLSGILTSIVQLYKRFAISSVAPILYNLGIIIGIIFFYPIWGLSGVAYGVLLGAFLHTAIHVPFVYRRGLFPRITRTIDWGSVKATVVVALQRGIGLGVQYIGLLFLTGFATTIAAGSVSVMTFAQNLQGMLLALIGMSYAVATFPTLSRVYAEGNIEEFASKLNAALRHIIFWSLPAIALVIVLRAHIVRTVLGAGVFDWTATYLTAACLAIFSLAILFQGIVMLIFRAMYASNRNTDVMIIAVVSESLMIFVAYLGLRFYESSTQFQYFLESLFRIDHVSGGAVIIIPIAFVLGYIVKSFFGMYRLRTVLNFHYSGVIKTSLHSLAASGVMALATYQFLDYFGNLFGIDTFWGVFGSGLLSGIMGMLIGAFVLYMLKNQEFNEVMKAIRRKFNPEEIVAPQEVK
jgi:putative peptidoglycan lipid II flippase